MIRNHRIKNFVRFFKNYYNFGFVDPHRNKEAAYQYLRERMYNEAIRDNGIYATFRFRKEGCYDTVLDYIQIEYPSDMSLYPDMFKKDSDMKRIPLSQTDRDIQDYNYIIDSCLMYNQTGEVDDKLKHEFEEIKEECVRKHNAIYSTVIIDKINIYENSKTIFIHYDYFYIKDDFINKINSDDVIFGEAPLPYGEWFIDYFGPYPKDRPRKNDSNAPALSKDVYKSLKNKEYINYVDCTPPAHAKNAIRYCSSDAMISELLLKENKNMTMIVHLLIVPEGMSEEFVNNTKKNLQSDDETTLYVSSNDIAFEPNDRYKTKYELLEHWAKSGHIYCVEFMVGYENDPEAKAFESFIRGIQINSRSSADTVNLWYQKDTIERTIRNLRDDYVESSKARDRLDNITDKIMDKVKSFKEYGLDDGDFDNIRNGNCFKDVYNATVDKITEIAFDSDKKGNKKK